MGSLMGSLMGPLMGSLKGYFGLFGNVPRESA